MINGGGPRQEGFLGSQRPLAVTDSAYANRPLGRTRDLVTNVLKKPVGRDLMTFGTPNCFFIDPPPNG